MIQILQRSLSRNGPHIGVMILSALAPFLLWSCSRDAGHGTDDRPVAVRAVTPVVRDMGRRLSYMGTVRAQQEVKVIAQVQGTVVDLPVEEGRRIHRGDVVARMDAPELAATVDRLRVEQDYWCRRYEADRRLVAAEALSQEQMESSRRACLSARAAVSEAESRQARTVEISPMEGEVLRWFVEPGQSLMPGQPILLLGGDRLDIEVEVVEEDLRRGIAVGTRADVETLSGGRFSTEVYYVAPVGNGLTRTFTVKLPMPARYAENVRKGGSVRVDFVLVLHENVVAVPIGALADRENDPHVFLIQGERAIRQAVAPGIEEEGWVEVLFPWNDTDPVAVSYVDRLADSTSVFSVLTEE